MKKLRSVKGAALASALLGALLLATFFFLLYNRSGGGKKAAAKEEELACFLEEGKGVGKAAVTLCYSSDGQTVTGAAVVCDGGNDPAVRAEVVRLVCAALGIGANRVYVSAKKTDGERAP